jgi:transposase
MTKKTEKEVIEDVKYKVAAETGKAPSDVVVEVVRKQGRRTTTKYKPTDDDYSKVEEMVTIGLDQHTIARIMGVSIATLVKYYRHTLDTAKDKRTASVAGVAYKMAMSGESASMTTFWLKTQGGWTPKQHVIHEDRSFDISWSEDEEDIADANNRAENNVH